MFKLGHVTHVVTVGHCTVLCPNKRLKCRQKIRVLWETPKAVVDQKAKKDLLIMMGDFNAKIGKDNIGK